MAMSMLEIGKITLGQGMEKLPIQMEMLMMGIGKIIKRKEKVRLHLLWTA